MNINKWMCERYDKKGKGYVEIGDILSELFSIGELLGLGILFLNGGKIVISGFMYSIPVNPVQATYIQVISIMIFILGCMGIVCVILFILLYCICTTKIARCKR